MLSKYRGYALCPECKGQRLRAEARAVRIGDDTEGGRNICEAAALTIGAADPLLPDALKLSPMQEEIAGSILEEIRQRLTFLDAVGLDYLTLDRLASTLSGGESQRIQLATSLGSRLVGALYVLDEPSIGLHTRDTARLIRILDELRDLGNTILVVEHDPDVLRSADYLLDLGPGAGEFGGKVLAAGTVEEVSANPASITGKYLSGQLTIPVPTRRHAPGPAKEWLRPQRRARQQPQRHRRRNSAQPARGHHRRLRLGQVHPGPPGSLPRRRPRVWASTEGGDPSGVYQGPHRRRAPQRRHPRRPDPHRPHAALQPRHLHQGLRRCPRTLRLAARGQAPRLHRRPLLLQRPRRPLRRLRRRRHRHRRNAVPRRRRAALRRVRRHPLQGHHPRRSTTKANPSTKSCR